MACITIPGLKKRPGERVANDSAAEIERPEVMEIVAVLRVAADADPRLQPRVQRALEKAAELGG